MDKVRHIFLTEWGSEESLREILQVLNYDELVELVVLTKMNLEVMKKDYRNLLDHTAIPIVRHDHA
jgi:hypothetical protein